ncbi:MAG: serine hydrolase, partial [Chloroflexia bacterium]|nr:serine hydrolase [Chloroflexia bacterium]
IYNQLGLKTITYHPLDYYSKSKIIPTELDNSWRYGLLHGFVHDPSAALLGGMTGNAGLYSDAHDLGILFQMVLNKGSYGGIQYLKPNVVETFTKRFDDTQRALGFDMPNRKAIVGKKASQNTFGHSGYTGTCVWVDPDNQIVYVFLSNRNHPSGDNWKIVTHKIRERIHDAIYDAIIKTEDKKENEGKLIVENQVQ